MDLREIQLWLGALGLYRGRGTGAHGLPTRRAVIRFLEDGGVPLGQLKMLRPRTRLAIAAALLTDLADDFRAAVELAGRRPTMRKAWT